MSDPAAPPARYSPARYSSAAILLHWVLAALLLFQLSLGWRLDTLDGVAQFVAFQLHKSIGISILLLSFIRLAIRFMVPRPAPIPASPALSFLASATHWLLYVVMIAGPLTGWALVSTAKIRLQTLLFGTVPWPHLPLPSSWNKPAGAVHELIGYLLVILVVLHVAGALRHHLLRDDVIGRMMPRAISSWRGLTIAAIVAILGGFGAMVAARYWPLPSPPVPAARPVPLAPAENAVEAATVNEAAEAVPAVANEAANAATNEAEDDAKAAVPWRVQAGGKLGFSADYSGTAIEGSFKRWDADILFSPDDLPGSKISVTVDLATVDSADSERDTMIASDSFFDVATHPRATFRSGKITHRSGNAYRAAGTLTLHGQSRPTTLDFTLDIKGDEATAAGTAPISRTAFGVGSGQWASTDEVKDGVTVHFNLKAKRAPAK